MCIPLTTLTATESPVQLLQQVAQQVSTIESSQQRQELSAYAQLITEFRFDKALIRRVFHEGSSMRESVIYQEILQEAETKGRAEGETKAKLRVNYPSFSDFSRGALAAFPLTNKRRFNLCLYSKSKHSVRLY